MHHITREKIDFQVQLASPPELAQIGDALGVGNEHDLEVSTGSPIDRQRNAIERHRAFRRDEARKLRRRPQKHAKSLTSARAALDACDAIHVSEHQVATEARPDAERALEVQDCPRRQSIEGRAARRLLGNIRLEAPGAESGDRQADAVYRNGLPQLEVRKTGRDAHTGAWRAAGALFQHPGCFHQAREHGASHSMRAARLRQRDGPGMLGQVPGLPASFLSSGVLVLLGSAFAVACGPSVQAIHEGDVRFEHCYRLDLDIAPTHRQLCWKRWLTSYTYGQPRDRLEYARRRVRAFATGDVTRPSLEQTSASAPVQPPSLGVVPAPTSLHSPPPPIASVVAPDAGAPTPATPPKAEPNTAEPQADCSDTCKENWESCAAACGPDAGASAGCRRCERDYKACMKRCFR